MSAIDFLNEQYTFTEDLIKKLEPYQGRNISSLPADILAQTKKIHYGHKPTSSGIESVKSILESLYVTSFYLKQAIDNPETFEQNYIAKKPVVPADKITQPSVPPAPDLDAANGPQPMSRLAPTTPKPTPKPILKIKLPPPPPGGPQPKSQLPPSVSKIEL